MRWSKVVVRRRLTIVLASTSAIVQVLALAAPDRMPEPQMLAPLWLATLALGMVHMGEHRRLAGYVEGVRGLPPPLWVETPRVLKVWTVLAAMNAVALMVWFAAEYGPGKPVQVSDQAFFWEVDQTIVREITRYQHDQYWGFMLAVFAALHQALVLAVGWRANVVLLQLQIMESREPAHGDAA